MLAGGGASFSDECVAAPDLIGLAAAVTEDVRRVQKTRQRPTGGVKTSSRTHEHTMTRTFCSTIGCWI